MKTSTTVKILLALFLAAFLWVVLVSIQTPRKGPAGEQSRELRAELVNRAENITLEAGSIKIQAKVQETYRNGEIHYQDFTITQTRDDNRIVITGKTAQTRSEGSDISFVEMERNISVRSTQGLRLKTDTLNYEGAKKRLFTNDPSVFTLNNLSGHCERFVFNTETRLLEMDGNVRAKMNLGDKEADEVLPGVDEATVEESADIATGDETADVTDPAAADDPKAARQAKREARREQKQEEKAAAATTRAKKDIVNIACDHVEYDQENHTVNLSGKTRIARSGSYIIGKRVDAKLTDDNRQFTIIDVFETDAREEPQEEPESGKKLPDPLQIPLLQPLKQPGGSTLSNHSAGIKTLTAQELHLEFLTGDENVIRTVNARGNAVLEIAPTNKQSGSDYEQKRIAGETIDSTLGEHGVGIRSMRISAAAGQKARVDIKPQGRPARRKRQAAAADGSEKKEPPKPKSATARSFDITVDPETNDFSIIVMTGGVEFTQGDLITTSDSGRYEKAKEQLQITGKPVLRDGVKRVTSQSPMTVSLDIGDLAADNTVESLFYAKRAAGAQGPALFAIGGGKLEDTIITSGSLRLDYRNNILRYAGNVRVNQGSTTIQSQNLDIFLADTRLVAYGAVSADLSFSGAVAKPAADSQKPAAESDKSANKRLFLSGERLDINKEKRSVRIIKNARAEQNKMVITAEQEISYDLSEDDELLSSTARTNVRVDVENFAIFGDKAVFNFQDRLLQVDGKNVRYLQEGKTEGSYGRVEYETESGTMRFYSRADQLVKTRILK